MSEICGTLFKQQLIFGWFPKVTHVPIVNIAITMYAPGCSTVSMYEGECEHRHARTRAHTHTHKHTQRVTPYFIMLKTHTYTYACAILIFWYMIITKENIVIITIIDLAVS